MVSASADYAHQMNESTKETVASGPAKLAGSAAVVSEIVVSEAEKQASVPSHVLSPDIIRAVGAATNNLDISDIPKKALTVVTGVSGSESPRWSLILLPPKRSAPSTIRTRRFCAIGCRRCSCPRCSPWMG